MDCIIRYILAFSLVILAERILPGVYELVASVAVLFTTLFLTSFAAKLVRTWFPPKQIYPGEKAVFITGCDSGFGHETAKRLDSLGFKVFAGCLKPDGEGAQKLKKITSDNVHIVPLDVTKDESVDNALQIVKNNIQTKELWGVINNAGVAPIGEVEFSPLSEFKDVFEINAMGPVRISKAFLPLLRQSKGRLIILASVAGRIAVPGLVPYSMTKFAAVALGEGLRREMKKWRVKVITVEPWEYRTNIVDSLENRLNKAWENSPEDVRKDYGTRYFESVKKRIIKISEKSNPNIHEVIDCMVDALISEEPRLSYNPGYFRQKVLYSFWKYLPPVLRDKFLLFQSNVKLPDTLRRQE